jgi:hypothetical protein
MKLEQARPRLTTYKHSKEHTSGHAYSAKARARSRRKDSRGASEGEGCPCLIYSGAISFYCGLWESREY